MSPPGQGYRFPRSARLLAAADFKRAFARPQRSSDKFFTVLATPNDLGMARLGLAIAKKQVRHAVQRNRLKRLVREAFRQGSAKIGTFDLVVMARRAAAGADNRRLTQSLCRHFDRIGQTDGK